MAIITELMTLGQLLEKLSENNEPTSTLELYSIKHCDHCNHCMGMVDDKVDYTDKKLNTFVHTHPDELKAWIVHKLPKDTHHSAITNIMLAPYLKAVLTSVPKTKDPIDN